MLRAIWLALGLSTLGCGGPATFDSVRATTLPEKDGPAPELRNTPPRIAEIAYVDGRVWLRGENDALYSVVRGKKRIEAHLTSSRVFDIHRTRRGRLWVLAIDPETNDTRVWERDAKGFHPILEMSTPFTHVRALAERKGQPLVVGEGAVFWMEHATIHSKELDERLRPGFLGAVRAATADDGSVYIGVSSTSSGGKLLQIDLATGKSQTIVERGEGDSCTHAMDPDCEPITEIVRDPDDPRCVLAGIGLATLAEKGRVLRVCGEKRAPISGSWSGAKYEILDTRLLLRLLGHGVRSEGDTSLGGVCAIQPELCVKSFDRSEWHADANISLATSARGVWIASETRLYHRARNRVMGFVPPNHEDLGGIALGWGPGVVSVARDARNTIPHSAPLVAATRDEPEPPTLAIPASTCWASRDGTSLCFEPDRYFVRRNGSWNSGILTWKVERDSVIASTPNGFALSVEVHGDTLRLELEAKLLGKRRPVAAWFNRMTGPGLERSLDEIRKLSPSEPALR